MIDPRPVTRDTVNALIRLKLAAHQTHLVAPSAVTIAQAAYEPGAHLWGLHDGDTAVGLVALLDPRGHPPFLTYDDEPQAAFLWRLMIDADHQGRGHGIQVIEFLKQTTRAWGLPRLAASVSNVPDSNIGFYEVLGFTRTGKIIDDEIVISIDV